MPSQHVATFLSTEETQMLHNTIELYNKTVKPTPKLTKYQVFKNGIRHECGRLLEEIKQIERGKEGKIESGDSARTVSTNATGNRTIEELDFT